MTAYLVLFVLIVLRFLPFLFPESRTWGFNHLIFLPNVYSVIFLVIAVVAMIIPFFKSSEKWGDTISGWFSDRFFDNRLKHLYRMIFIAIMTALFIIFAAPTHFLGDGFGVINNLAAKTWILLKWSEIGIIIALRIIRPLFGPQNEQTARLVFQTVSILSGAVTIFFLFQISQVITRDRVKRFLLFVTSLLSGSLLLFFGYAEYYPVIWVFMIGFFYFGLKFINLGQGLTAAWIFLLIGVILHLQMAIFIPAAIYISFAAGKGRPLYERYKKTIWSTIIVLLAISIVALIHKYFTDLYIEDMFLKPFVGKPIYPDYSIFGILHLLDIANEIMLVSPLLILFLIVGLRNLISSKLSKPTIFLGLVSIASLSFLFAIDPKLGMPRDWDLFSLNIFPITMLLVFNLQDINIKYIGRLLMPLGVTLIIFALPNLLTNLHDDRSAKYLEYLIRLDYERGFSSFLILEDYAVSQGDMAKADSIKSFCFNYYTEWRKSNQAMRALNNGDVALGTKRLSLLKPNKFDAEYHRMLAKLAYLKADYPKALSRIEAAIQLRPYYFEFYCERGKIYSAMGYPEKFIENYLIAYQINESAPLVLNGLAFMYSFIEKYDSSIYYGEKMLEVDTTNPQTYLSLGISYIMRLDLEQARKIISRYEILAKDDTTLINSKNELINLLKSVEEDPPNDSYHN